MTRLRLLLSLSVSVSILCLGMTAASAQGSVIRTIPVPESYSVEVNSLLGRLYVGGVDSLSIIDSSTFQTVTTLTGVRFTSSAIDQTLAKLYLAHADEGVLRVLDMATNTWLPSLMDSGAFAVALHTTDNRVFVSGGTSVSVFDGPTGTAITTLDFGSGNGTAWMAVNPVTNRLYVQTGDGQVNVVDLNTYNVIDSFPITGLWVQMIVNPLTNQLYVVEWQGPDYVVQIDLSTNSQVGRRSYADNLINGIAINPINNHLYLSGTTNTSPINFGRLMVVDMTSNQLLDTEAVGDYFFGVTADPLTSRVYALAHVPPTSVSGANRVLVFQDAGPNFNQSPTRNFWQEPPTLTWNPVSGATGYEVQVDNNAAFTSPEYQNNALGPTDLQVTTPELPDGLYSWRVRARRADNTWGAWSAVDTLVVND